MLLTISKSYKSIHDVNNVKLLAAATPLPQHLHEHTPQTLWYVATTQRRCDMLRCRRFGKLNSPSQQEQLS